MKIRNIFSIVCGAALVFGFTSCKNGDRTFDDYEGGTSVYFPYQYPVRTIALGDEEYDTSLDQAHKCQIQATFGGSYNGSNGTVQVAVDNSLVEDLYFEDGTPVKAMPSNYYSLSTTSLAFNGTMNGKTEVTLTDAFFADPDAVKNTYVIPLVMTGQSGFTRILAGQAVEGATPKRTNDVKWIVLPMDYVLYCVKYQNRYTGYWLTNHTTSTDDIEHADIVQITTKSLNSAIYTVSYQVGQTINTVDLLLDFSGDNCNISSLTDGVTASGSGTFGDNAAKKAWGNKDRDQLDLNYNVTFADGSTLSRNERLIWQRSGITIE